MPTPYDSYAEVVAFVGPEAYLYGESVIAMHELAPTNPTCIYVATPKRIRRKLPEYLRVVRRSKEERKTIYENIPSQSIADAIRSCRGKIMDDRLLDAVRTARAKGYLTRMEEKKLLEEFS